MSKQPNEKLLHEIVGPVYSGYSAPKQSANTLFRFFTEPDFLFSSIKNRALIPRYYGENVDYLDIGYHQISYPMVCFCDITVHRLQEHIGLYGGYGIAFSKKWGIKKGIQPIQYINKHSVLCQDFSVAFKSAIQSENDNVSDNYLLTHMLFMKPIEGMMPRNGGEIHRIFTDECEWRYIPNVASIELPQVVTEDNAASIGILNKTISENDCCWLKFDYSDIKYVIVPTEADFEQLCNILDQEIESESTKRRIISKIILWTEAKEDF